jgi:hypothetical protein
MATVPSAYIKDKEVNYEGEIFAILGEGCRVESFHFRPPSLGVWALWEILDSPVIHGDENATSGDWLRLLWINDVRKDAVSKIAKWCGNGRPTAYVDGDWCELDEAVIRWASSQPFDILSDEGFLVDVAEQVALSHTGYETIPATGESSGQYLFAGEAFGSMIGQSLAHSDALIWETPMTLHGHVAARRAKANGEKGVGRPKDPEDIKLQLKLANEREARGELHEWQELEPLAFPLSSEQCKHPNLIARFEALCDKAKGKS